MSTIRHLVQRGDKADTRVVMESSWNFLKTYELARDLMEEIRPPLFQNHRACCCFSKGIALLRNTDAYTIPTGTPLAS